MGYAFLEIRNETQAGAVPESTFHVGDQPEDTEASRAAKVTADRIGLEPRRQDGAGSILHK
jgi:phosphoglycolate phosphatase-like HAD superfamily hydrolase